MIQITKERKKKNSVERNDKRPSSKRTARVGTAAIVSSKKQ